MSTKTTITDRTADSKERVVFLDWLRVAACLMVIAVHSIEPFYLGGEGTYIRGWTEGVLCTLISSALRAAVPLFVMISAFLLVPVKGSASAFLKRRGMRVAIPLAVWVLLYALIPLPGSDLGAFRTGDNLARVVLNFPDAGGHLWYCYMILGVYLAMPVISPWLAKLSKKEELAVIALWLFTTALPFLRKAAAMVYGKEEVYGEASWNSFGMFYYASGFIGYVIVADYLRKYCSRLNWKKTLAAAVPMWIAGYAVTASWFWSAMPKLFPVNGPIEIAVEMETSWCFSTFGVALTTIAYFLIAIKIKASGKFYRKVVVPLSKISFGIYLMHIFLLCFFMQYTGPWFAQMNQWAGMPLCIAVNVGLTFLTSALLTKLVSYIPGSKYITG